MAGRTVAAYTLTSSATSQQTTTATLLGTTRVRIAALQNTWIAQGINPVASVGGAGCYLFCQPVGAMIVAVYPGEKFAVIQDTAAGVVNFSELVGE